MEEHVRREELFLGEAVFPSKVRLHVDESQNFGRPMFITSILILEGGPLVRRVFKRFLLISHQNERFYQHKSMRSRQKAVPYWKMNDFSRFFSLDNFQNSRFRECRNSGFWNSGILELPKRTILKAEMATRNRPSNWPFPEIQDPGIPEFRILEF